MNDSMNTAAAQGLADSELAEVVGGAETPQQGSLAGLIMPTIITLPNGTVLTLPLQKPPSPLDTVRAVAGYIR